MTAVASAVVRTYDSSATVEATFASLRAQDVPVEIVVVDSGSTDGTLDLARRYADLVLEVPHEEFSYGGTLNRGAAAASAPVHVLCPATARSSAPTGCGGRRTTSPAGPRPSSGCRSMRKATR